MRKLFIPLLVSVVFLVPAGARAQNTCKGADSTSARVIALINKLMAGDQAAARAKFALPLVTSSQIALSANPTLCAQAGTAANALTATWTGTTPPTSSAPLYVFQIGSTFAVVDPAAIGEDPYDVIWFFGVSWNYSGLLFMA